jgi:hypothetical protein
MNRRQAVQMAAMGSVAALSTTAASFKLAGDQSKVYPPLPRSEFVTARDGTRLFVQDWGSGQPSYSCVLGRSIRTSGAAILPRSQNEDSAVSHRIDAATAGRIRQTTDTTPTRWPMMSQQ